MKKWWNWLVVIALLCLLLIVIPISYNGNSQQQLQSMFDEYIEKFNKSYKSDPNEYETRYQHFLTAIQEIEQLNSESRGPEERKARYGLTRLSDMSKQEYKDLHLSDERMEKSPHMYGRSWTKYKDVTHSIDGGQSHSRRRRAALPLQVDWRAQGVVGPVRDQGLCGACWAFSTIGTMESMAAIKTGKLQTLSVQEAIDCAGLGNSGCLGGDICLLLDWLSITNTAVVPDNSYPLKLSNGVCKMAKNATGVHVASYTCDDFVGAEDKIIEALATHGPVSVAVNALTWQNYLGGVIQYNCGGSAKELNHAVQLVGYDMVSDVPYYIAKNSWGPEFGNSGYVHLAVGSNICGLANEVATVDVK